MDMNFAITVVAGASLGANVVLACMVTKARRDAHEFEHMFDAVFRRLVVLRNKCFLTNERGHRVRYWRASDAVRAKAEGRDHG